MLTNLMYIKYTQCAAGEREAVGAAERAERKQQLREKVCIAGLFFIFC